MRERVEGRFAPLKLMLAGSGVGVLRHLSDKGVFP